MVIEAIFEKIKTLFNRDTQSNKPEMILKKLQKTTWMSP